MTHSSATDRLLQPRVWEPYPYEPVFRREEILVAHPASGRETMKPFRAHRA
jgi:hypothetical protein